MTAFLDFTRKDLASDAPPTASSSAQLESASAPPSPIATLQTARVLNGNSTEVLVQAFADRIFILVTQLGRIGSLIQVNPPPPTLPAPLNNPKNSLFPSLPTPHPSTTLTTLFGVPPSPHLRTIYELYATMAGTIVFSDVEEGDRVRPVVLGIALKPAKDLDEEGVTEQEREVFGMCMEMIKECRVW